MINVTKKKIIQFLEETDGLYYKLVLLVGTAGVGKTTLLNDVSKELDVSIINVNLEVSKQLIELSSKQRQIHFNQILDDVIDNGCSIKILDNIEILLDKSLKQDPLKVLQKISRNYITIASWNGYIENGKLLYAEPNHPEYRNYNVDNTLIVEIDSINN